MSTQVTDSHTTKNHLSSASNLSQSTLSDPSMSSCSGSSTTSSSNTLDDIVNDVFGQQVSLIPTNESPKTFKIVMDNIDKTIKPNDMRMDHQTRSLHYVHKYAVRDRIDLSSFDDKPCLPDIGIMKVNKVLPSVSDNTSIRANMSTLVARVLVENLPFLKGFKLCIGLHIQHKFSNEMSQESEVVSIL